MYLKQNHHTIKILSFQQNIAFKAPVSDQHQIVRRWGIIGMPLPDMEIP